MWLPLMYLTEIPQFFSLTSMVNWIEDMYCCEFSNTYAVPGTMQVNRQTRFHKGSVAGSSPEGGVNYFHNSFRAFRGASGAPVFVQEARLCTY